VGTLTRRGRLEAALSGPPQGGPYIAIALVAAVSASLLAQAPASTAKPVTTLTSPVTGNAVTGKKLYSEHLCYSCHGFNGETGARTFVPNWPANLATERSFVAFLRGRANVAPVQPSTSMPNYPVESLSDSQAKDVYAYIRSFTSTPPPIEKIPTMMQILAAAQKPYKK
jgi:mono/diheme cytochrome c family protein